MMLPDFLARQLAAHAIGLRCSPTVTRSVPSLLNESSTPPSNVPRQRHVSALTSCLSTASFFADLHQAGFVSGGFGPAHIGAATRPIGENAACSARAPLRDGTAVRWNRLKIATNVVGVICSPEPREPLVILSQRKQRQYVLMGRSGYQKRSAWDLVQLRAWTGPIEKMSHCGESPIWHHTAERQAEFCCTRHPLSDCNLS